MLILRPYEYKLLLPQGRQEWRAPSLGQPKTVFGHENHTRFRLTARLNDGHIAWRGWFDDREDADAFLDALARHIVLGSPMPREVWDLPTPSWFPGIGEGIEYYFSTQIFVVSGTSQTSPSDWDNATNSVEGLGGGASGAVSYASTSNCATGGGGAEYRKITNFSVATPGTTAFNYTIGTGGTAIVRTTTGSTAGNVGVQTTFNTSSLIAKPGLAGAVGANPQSGGTGGTGGTGAAANFDGGRGGNSGSFTTVTTGGGGAAGPSAAGVAGVDGAGNGTAKDGGQGDGVAGGTGSAGVTGNAGVTTSPGNAGTEFGDGIHGSGGGSGGARNGGATTNATAGTAGAYGAGGGAALEANASATGTATSGAGGQGLLWFTYTPLVVATKIGAQITLIGWSGIQKYISGLN